MNNSLQEANTMETRYQRARTFMHGMFTSNLVLNATLYPTWIGESDCFWYEHEIKDEKETSTGWGKEYRLVNAKTAVNECAFDHVILADILAEAAQQEVNADNLPIKSVKIHLNTDTSVSSTTEPSTRTISEVYFTAFDKRWLFHPQSESLKQIETPRQDEIISPDARHAVFARDFNIWIRDIESGSERALTQDGEEHYVYGALGTAWGRPTDSGLQVRWSPDSKRIFTVQRDTRQVKAFPIVEHVPRDGSLRPQVNYVKMAMPGDDAVETLRLLTIEIETGLCRDANYRQIPVTRNSQGFFNANLGWWATDSSRAYFVDLERDYKTVRVVELDPGSGSTSTLFEETTDTHIRLMLSDDEFPTLLPLPETGELLWFSERSGWAHLYLYNLETGDLKNPVTSGNWLVRHILHFDAKKRDVFVQTMDRKNSNNSEILVERDPYYRDLARVNIDTGEMTTLISSDHDYTAFTPTEFNSILAKCYDRDVAHASSVSPSGNYAVVTRSRADEIPVSLLVDREGREITTIDTADISALPDGWQWPEPVKLKAADGISDIYGLVFRPSDFSSDKSYPIVTHVFNCPELLWVSKGSFSNGAGYGGAYLEGAALAELGFIVVQIDGRGSPFREKAFTDELYGWLESASNLDDHVAGIRQLAGRYPYMDLNRVGIVSFSGGPAGVQGLLHYPDFYKVGVSSILHDGRLMSAAMFGEKFEGLAGPSPDHKYPEQLAENLQGKLLLMHGMLDYCCLPSGAFRVVEALQRANKDFDMLFLSNVAHFTCGYQVRRAWDYLVKHLLDVEPPKEFELTTIYDKYLAS